MKRFSVSRFAAAAALFVGTALLAVSPAFAGNPLNAPRGLAVAANGDLYVANQSGNSILVFNPSYQYLPAKTITAGIDKPSGVAIDPLGNIYVSNWTDGEVTVYSSTGVQNVNSTISGLNAPQGIAVDSIGNIYVDENYQDVRVYGATTVGKSTPVLVSTYNPGQDIFSIAAHNQLFGWGGLTSATGIAIDQVLTGNGSFQQGAADEALAVAFDASTNLYVCNTDNTVNYVNFTAGLTSTFVTLSFPCEGIAVDSARGRVYMSNQQGNAIDVYSTSGALLKVIQ